MKNSYLFALLAVSIFTLPAFAENPLDQQLGPAPAPAPAAADVKPSDPKTAPDAKPDEPLAPELVSPKAAKAVDDQELANSLTGNHEHAPNAGSADDAMKNIVERMNKSADRLNQTDAGDITQETQRRIVMDLDVLIELARKQQQQSSSSKSNQQRPGQAQQRTMSQGSQSQGGSSPANSSFIPGGSPEAPQSNGRNLREQGREWGNLPPGDRDLVVNGANEEFLSAYKDMIKRYYEALAEVGKPRE